MPLGSVIRTLIPLVGLPSWPRAPPDTFTSGARNVGTQVSAWRSVPSWWQQDTEHQGTAAQAPLEAHQVGGVLDPQRPTPISGGAEAPGPLL